MVIQLNLPKEKLFLICKFKKNWSSKQQKLKLIKSVKEQIGNEKKPCNATLIKYFEKYQAFCFDLSSDSVLKGDLNFRYK